MKKNGVKAEIQSYSKSSEAEEKTESLIDQSVDAK
jgi:hypothetical protein